MMIADSDVLIDFLRGRDPAAARIRAELAAGALATTSINSFELLSGARASSERGKIERLLDALIIYPIDQAASVVAAEIRRQLEQRGEGIGMADYLIAGICLIKRAPLLTRNKAHFSRVPHLTLGKIEP
jgi:tRNA(fMet)-specific endonuclease VapC